jgi:methionyl aminopeptidase
MSFLRGFKASPTKHPSQWDNLRRSGAAARDVLLKLASQVSVGATTKDIDRLAASEIKARGCTSAFLGYKGFPGNICISINEEVVHGIGGSRVIADGDVVKIDVGVVFQGWIGDNALTVPVGTVEEETIRLLAATEESLHRGAAQAVDGNMMGDLSFAVENFVTTQGFTVVRELVGHGVGRKLHEEPQVPNFGKKGERPRLKTGMCLAIEPMINRGKAGTRTLADGWTVITQDRQPSSHFEHMVLITESGPEILTPRDRMYSPERGLRVAKTLVD